MAIQGGREITSAQQISDAIITNDKLVTPGTVLQTLQFESNTTTSATSTTYVDTAITLTITPSSTSSKILGIAVVGGVSTPSDIFVFTRVYNSTSSTVVSNIVRYDPRSQAFLMQHASHTFLDSPSSTSPQTYVIQLASDRTATSYFNRRDDNASFNSNSSIILMEIAA